MPNMTENIDITCDSDEDIMSSTGSSVAGSETIGSTDTADWTMYDVHFGSIVSPFSGKT